MTELRRSALSPAERSELLKIATSAAAEAATLACTAFASPRTSAMHKGAVDLVTETDLAVEALLRERLGRETSFAILGEEAGASGALSGLTWVVDPIDGTTNFAHRHPCFAVSIGLVDYATSPEQPLLGVVHAPALSEVFTSDGAEARLNGSRLPPLGPVALDVALLATGFPYDRRTNPDNNTDLASALLTRCQGIRRIGAAALDLAWLAAGRVDGFWELRLKPWDAAAGVVLVRAVGGLVTDDAGTHHRLDAGVLVAAHPALHADMLRVIQAVRPPCAGLGTPRV